MNCFYINVVIVGSTDWKWTRISLHAGQTTRQEELEYFNINHRFKAAYIYKLKITSLFEMVWISLDGVEKHRWEVSAYIGD